MQYPEIIISKRKFKGKWIVTVHGITSGAEIKFQDEDSGSISFGFDAARFEPIVKIKQ